MNNTNMTLQNIEDKLNIVSLSESQKDYLINLLELAHGLGYMEGVKTTYGKYKEIYGR